MTNNLYTDIHLEHFWNSFFKKNIINFCEELINYELDIPLEDIPIETWSNILNDLQKEEKYDIIEKYIFNYILEYGEFLVKYGYLKHNNNFRYNDIRYCDFYLTNIKRWNRISQYQINSECEIYNYFKIYKYFIEKENYDLLNNFTNKDIFIITDYAIKNNLDNILDYCLNIKDVRNYITTQYHITINNMNAKKIIRKINS
jgi:hypothetical protein